MIRLVSFTLISVAYAVALSSKLSLTGDHICRKEENYTETVNTTSSKPIQVRKNFWCIEKIRCSELKADVKEIVESKNLTKTRTIEFCCPNYEEVEENGKLFCRSSCKCVNGNCSTSGKCDCGIGFTGEFCEQACPPNKFGDMCMKYCKCGDHKCDAITGECLKGKVTSTVKPEKSSKPEPSVINQNHTVVMIMPDINPYRVHSPREIEGESEELQNVDYQDGNEFIYLDTNELPDIETTPTYLDHHQLNQHNESMAMVTVGCVVLGMFVFLIVMVILRRLTRRRRVDHEDDFQETMKQIKLDPAKIVYPPMPIAPLRPSLRKSKSVTFDDSFDEVDEKNPKDLHNPSDTYDVPRKQSSMTDLTNRAPPMIPLEMSSKCFNTFPKRISTPNKSLEHIYAEIQSKKA